MMLYVVLTTLLAGVALATVPDYIKVCGRRNPKLEKCVLDSVAGLNSKLKQGIPELDVPTIEPLDIDEITLANDPTFKAIAQNVKFYGFPDYEAKSLRVDLKNQRFDIDLFFRKIRLLAEYDVATRVVVPIAGKGPIDIVAENVTAKVTLKFQLVDRKGAKYLYFPSMTTKLFLTDYTSVFKPRGGSDGTLAQGINAALNGNRQELINIITPNIEKVVSERVLYLANKICKHFKYEELFPDRE